MKKGTILIWCWLTTDVPEGVNCISNANSVSFTEPDSVHSVSGSNLTPPTMLQFAKTRKLSIERADPRRYVLSFINLYHIFDLAWIWLRICKLIGMVWFTLMYNFLCPFLFFRNGKDFAPFFWIYWYINLLWLQVLYFLSTIYIYF